MHLDLVCESCCLTDFAYLCQKPLFEFRSAVPFGLWPVFRVCLEVPSQTDPTPVCYQWLFSFAHYCRLQYLSFPPFYFNLRLVLLVDFGDRGFVLVCSRLCQRLFHY